MSFDQDKEMHVTKRNGSRETISFDKILRRVKKLGEEIPQDQTVFRSVSGTPNMSINYTNLVIKVIDQLYDGITTTKIDELTSEQCASMSSIHPAYNALAGRIVISNHHKHTSCSFVKTIKKLYQNVDKHGHANPLVSHELYQVVTTHNKVLDAFCDYSRDYLIDYFGFKTLLRSYLMRIGKTVIERPQHMWLRVAIGIHGNNLERIKETYEMMSQKYFTHATPTLFNAGTPRPQLSSCFLVAMENDSIEGIFNTLKDCALISKHAGGIGLHIHNIRASNSHINGTNGSSNGIVPMLRVFNNTAKYVDQCVTPDTVIYTTKGPKKIQQVIDGETQIFNRSGHVETIKQVLEHAYDGEMLTFQTRFGSGTSLQITSEHPVLVMANNPFLTWTEDRRSSTTNDRGRETPGVVWTEATNLDIGDMIAHPVPMFYQDIETIGIDDCYLYGILLDAGQQPKHGSYHVRTMSMPLRVQHFVVSYLTQRCIHYEAKVMVDPMYRCEETGEDGSSLASVTWKPTSLLPFRHADFYDEAGEKYIHARWLNLPIEKSSMILKGMIDAGGFINKDIFYECDPKMTECMRFLALKMGVLSTISLNPSNIVFPPTQEMCSLLELEYDDRPCPYLKHVENDRTFLLNPIVAIEKTSYQGTLYDLQMTDEHNYLLSDGLVHNGGGKRNGSFAIYLEPWHADVEKFLQMKKNLGDEELKARDLFYALWIPDLFMKRVKAGETWTLMCPDECRGLSDLYGEEFDALYTKYEREGKGRITMNARDLWFQILDAQMETGTPYLLYKDACNRKSNQKNLGTIKSSNLCTEVVQYSDSQETAVCNLASIALPSCIDCSNGTTVYDFEKLHKIARTVTYNLNCVIDANFYPTENAKRSNMRHRPIGIGVQGLADVFMIMNLPFASEQANELNRQIFETIYHAALSESCARSQQEGPYETFVGSPASQGILQFDMWDVVPSNRYDWQALKTSILTHGLRNSLLLAPMPTASTSQILGYNECIEPITSNIYSRRTLAGEFVLTNKYLMRDLLDLGMWNEKMKNTIVANNGSIQTIEIIPKELREKYKTVWEIPMKSLIDMAVDRGAYICQSQSLNLWLEDPNYNSLTSMHFYSWSKGLKTGIYYLRRRAKHQAQQFTIEPDKKDLNHENNMDEEDVCEMCSS